MLYEGATTKERENTATAANDGVSWASVLESAGDLHAFGSPSSRSLLKIEPGLSSCLGVFPPFPPPLPPPKDARAFADLDRRTRRAEEEPPSLPPLTHPGDRGGVCASLDRGPGGQRVCGDPTGGNALIV